MGEGRISPARDESKGTLHGTLHQGGSDRFAYRARGTSPAGRGLHMLAPSMCVHRFRARPLTRRLPRPRRRNRRFGARPSRERAQTAGTWWKVFNDPQLNELEEKASSSSQEIAAAADNFLAARALVREARSQYFPTVTTNPSILNSRPSPGQFGGVQAGSVRGGWIDRQIVHRLLPAV